MQDILPSFVKYKYKIPGNLTDTFQIIKVIHFTSIYWCQDCKK